MKKQIRLRALFASLLVLFLCVSCLTGCDFSALIDDILGNIDLPSGGNGDTSPDHGVTDGDVIVNGSIQIHFLELGNEYTGDCTYVKIGETDILIDAGSRSDSVPTISAYLNQYVTDGKLEYVIATHAHQDHIAGFAGTTKEGSSIFDLYECETIIDFALTNSTTKTYERYLAERDAEIASGAVHYTAAELRESGNYLFTFEDGVTMTILDQRFYYEKTSDENDYSVCCLFSQGSYHYLFTGDLEAEGEASLVEKNALPEVMLFKGGHHGSYTASTETLLATVKPEIVCVCCCAGSDEYTKNIGHQFPAQEFCDRVAVHTERVYITSMINDEGNVTSMNGNIVVSGNAEGVTVTCSASDTLLKDTAWFKAWRTCPPAWKE